ncbi:MAG TPA: helix-turn-helix domain-containing protein [Candidatus Dormibacteraeota bacterium]|nr:helix-turn-helix domain-containing protein [Candidatus Dormibacteraeota bacterium]
MADVVEAITVKEAAAILHSTRSHVFWLIHTGRLAFKRVGKRFVVQRSEVERMAASGWQRVGVFDGRKLKTG